MNSLKHPSYWIVSGLSHPQGQHKEKTSIQRTQHKKFLNLNISNKPYTKRMACCIFKNCFNRPVPYSNITFFNVPKDSRRQQWLQRSGNDEVQNLPLTARRLVCEAHFEERHLRKQFHRTTLSRDAVPVSYCTVFQLKRDSQAGQQHRNDDGEGLQLEEVEAIQTDFSVQEVPTGSENEEIQYEVIETEEYLLEELELSDELNILGQQDTSKRKRYETISTQTDDLEKLGQSPPSKKIKCDRTISLTIDRATNTEPLVTETIPVKSPEKSSTMEQSTQTDEQKPPLNPNTQKTEDEYFMLSLLEPLQRLPLEKRAIAKVKMLTYLVQLGCGMGDVQL
ncbi:uncharacterized protein LOC135703219 [Ochlerotatus camptorhynchus]|uniref:uncharacterized protein LOC135703219 n=1 Tax=Ochlerotatus camptorhynchus TaxID=644619 RepID=UPI0031D7FCEA